MARLKLPKQPLQPFNVLAFDPGGTTGWAFASLPQYLLDEKEEVELKDIYLQTGEFGPEPHHKGLLQLITSFAYSESPKIEVVFEPFHFRQHMDNTRHKVELISCEYIGVIKLTCAQLGLTYYDRFTPGEAKRWTTDRKLQLLGWFQEPKHPMRHRNDALRQLVKYLVVKKGVRHPLTTAWRDVADES